MNESAFTKLRITKGVNDGMKAVLEKARSNASISQFAEELLIEACESIMDSTPPTLMPTVVKLRMRLGLPITPGLNPLLDRAVKYTTADECATERLSVLRVAEEARASEQAAKKPLKKRC